MSNTYSGDVLVMLCGICCGGRRGVSYTEGGASVGNGGGGEGARWLG